MVEPGKLAERIASFDIGSAGVSDLTMLLGSLSEIGGWVSVKHAEVTRRLSALAADGNAPPVSDVVARAGHTSSREAQKSQRHADAYGRTPAPGTLRAKGRVSDEHADALVNAAGKLTDDQRDALFSRGDELAVRAASSTPAQFARHLGKVADEITGDDGLDRSERQRAKASLTHGIGEKTGMGWFRGELHPDDYQKFARRLDAEIGVLRQRPEFEGQHYDQIAAAGFMGLVTGVQAVATPPAEVLVLIDLDTILHGWRPGSTSEYADGTPLPVDTVRRHACAADIIPVVLGGDGQPLDVGRAKRHATPAQRRALRSMYRSCGIDDCGREFDRSEIHHLLEWDRHRGPTDLDNLLPLCSHHHHRSHEGRWQLQLDPSSRQLTVRLPDGTLHSQCLPDIMHERRVA